MERTPEPELMEDEAQVRAYAEGDFSEPHGRFLELFRQRFPEPPRTILDLGCGPGDVTRRLARAYPSSRIVGIDASAEMLRLGRLLNRREGLDGRVELRQVRLPAEAIEGAPFGTVVSNSLLHHLDDPATLWASIRKFARLGSAVFVMDLLRPDTPEQVLALVDRYAGSEPEVLRRDFRNSLHAAYRVDEVREQIDRATLAALTVEVVSDRHFVVHGTVERAAASSGAAVGAPA